MNSSFVFSYRTRVLLGLSVFFLSPALAQVAPDAGRILREVAPPLAPVPSGKGVQGIAPETPRAGAGQTQPIAIAKVRITGNTVFSEAALLALVADVPGSEKSLAQLQEAAGRITAHYRAAGYLVARAYLPPQQLQDGTLTIAVLEGKLAKIKVENASRLSVERADAAFAGIDRDTPVNSALLDRPVLLLRDRPGVGAVDATLSAGENVGETDLSVSVGQSPLLSGRLEADNFGSLYTGRNRLGASMDVNSALGLGERVSIRVLGSDGELLNGRLAAQVPVGNNGLTVGGTVAHTTYSLGDAFASLGAVGHSTTAELNVRYPWIRSVSANLYAQAGYEYRKLRDEVRSTDTVTEKHANVGSMSLIGDLRDGLGGGGVTQGSLAVSAGKLGFDNPSAAAIDSVNAKTAGNYTKLAYSVERQQALPANFSLSLQVRGQWADSNLDSSEKFALGGPYGVRAYATSEAMGDRGWFASAELRYAITPWLSANVFHDHGSVEVNAKPYLASANTLHRNGNGIGLVGNYGDFDWRAYAAWRGNEASTAEPDKRPRFWLQAGWRF